jgi:hypothetical protein
MNLLGSSLANNKSIEIQQTIKEDGKVKQGKVRKEGRKEEFIRLVLS